MITSARNPKVQRIRALQRLTKRRTAAGAFVVEGVRLAEEALRSSWPPSTWRRKNTGSSGESRSVKEGGSRNACAGVYAR